MLANLTLTSNGQMLGLQMDAENPVIDSNPASPENSSSEAVEENTESE